MQKIEFQVLNLQNLLQLVKVFGSAVGSSVIVPLPHAGEGVRRTGEGKKAAFTLAETIITLGVIGIVAAITIPLLINTYRRIAYPAQLKTIYSKLLVVQKTLNEEYGTPDTWRFYQYTDGGEDNYTLEIINRYATQLSADYRGNIHYNPDKLGAPSSASMLNGKPAKNIPDFYTVSYIYSYGHMLVMKNGATINICFAQAPRGGNYWALIGKKIYAVFMVDINGLSKPNIVGRDIFMFSLKGGNNSIVPYMDNTTDCNKQGAGLSCSRKLIKDDWRMNY